MGSPLPPEISNICMKNLENIFLVKTDFRPKIWFRCVDILATLSYGDSNINPFRNHLNLGLFFVKGPAADATDAPQPRGLLCNPVMKMINLFFFLVMEHRWNETDRGKPKYSGKNLSQCHFVHHKTHMD
jgi:hypothetical protein